MSTDAARRPPSSTRRNFLKGAAFACVGASAGGCRLFARAAGSYAVSILGDTHFDATPQARYHGLWKPRSKNDWRDRQGEFARNAAMWTSRLPRLVASAASVCSPETAFLLQMGDLIQGDCSDDAVQAGMLRDACSACTKGFPDIPFLTVCGNHDIRCGGARAYDAFARTLAARRLGRAVGSMTFSFAQGPDAWIVLDFMRPDAAKINALLDATEGARHTFVALHSTIAPHDGWGPYWFLLGKPADTEARRALFRRLIARRAIVLSGHIHETQLRRWRRDGGELVEFAANSVWRPAEDSPKVVTTDVADYGSYVRAHPVPMHEDHDGCFQTRAQEEILSLLEEYRPGFAEYRRLRAAGHYRLNVTDRTVSVDFYACDARQPTERFALRG